MGTVTNIRTHPKVTGINNHKQILLIPVTLND